MSIEQIKEASRKSYHEAYARTLSERRQRSVKFRSVKDYRRKPKHVKREEQ